MGTIKKQSILNTLIAYAGVVIGFANTVLLMPRFLEEEEVGLIRLLPQIAVMYAQFSALGFGNMSLRYFPFFKDKANRHHGFLFLLLIVPMAGFAWITVMFLLFKPVVVEYYSENSALLVEYYYYIIPLAFFTLLFILFDSYLRSLYKSVVASFTQDFLQRLLISVSIGLYALKLVNFHEFVLIFIGVNSAIGLVLLVYVMWLRQFFVKPQRSLRQIKPIQEMLQYGLFAFMGNISSTIITTTDSLMISSMLSLAQTGIYSIAFFVTSVILIPAKSLYKTVYPKVAELWKQNDLPAMNVLYKRVTLLNLVIGCYLFGGIWANVDNIFALMGNPAYAQGRYVILFMGLARLFDLATGINGIIMVTSHKYRYDLIFNIMLVILVIWTNYLLIPRFGISGAAFASMSAYVVYNLLRLFFLKYHFKLQPFDLRSVYVLLFGGAALGATYLLPPLPNVFLDIVVRSGILTLIYGSALLVSGISPDVNQIARKVSGFVKKG